MTSFHWRILYSISQTLKRYWDRDSPAYVEIDSLLGNLTRTAGHVTASAVDLAFQPYDLLAEPAGMYDASEDVIRENIGLLVENVTGWVNLFFILF